MVTIVYCDYAAGSDDTGDGSAGKPYKTIDKASTGLSGGDEVRCAKSAAPSGLGGTLTFADGSTSVATSVDMTGSLAAKDFVGLNTAGETWWEIASITSTTITLTSKYVGTGGTGTGYKLGVTDTGAAAGSTTVVQQVSASGSSGNLLKISGGWNLAGTPTQDGQTWFWQSGTNKYGYGLQLSSKSYIELDFGRVGFLRYNRAIYLSSSNNNTITSATCNSNNSGIYLTSSSNNNTITSATCNSNSYGIYLGSGSSCVCWNYAHDESTWGNAGKINEWVGNKQKIVSVKESESGGAARNRVYFYGGYTQDNAAEARSGSCLQFNPKSATYWIEQSFFVPAAASTARTVSIYLKDDSSFNGSVWLELWFNGVRIAGPTEKTMTTSYVQESITGAADDIPVDGVLELKVLVYGTAGCVYADDISYS